MTISVVARGVEDLNVFMKNLQATGAFAQVGSSIEERVNEQGQLQATVDAVYKPATGHAAGRGNASGARSR